MNIQCDGPEDTGVAYWLFINDPDGHSIELTTYYSQPPSAAQSTRESCRPKVAGPD